MRCGAAGRRGGPGGDEGASASAGPPRLHVREAHGVLGGGWGDGLPRGGFGTEGGWRPSIHKHKRCATPVPCVPAETRKLTLVRGSWVRKMSPPPPLLSNLKRLQMDLLFLLSSAQSGSGTQFAASSPRKGLAVGYRSCGSSSRYGKYVRR